MTGLPDFDDDRLLAFAMGLDDDPKLVAAAADEGLRRRLDAVRAEVERVGAHVRAAVPDPDERYTDLSDSRWADLQEFFAASQPAAKTRSRASRWLRVLAPAAVVLVAVAVGLAVISDQRSGTIGVNDSLSTAGGASSEAASPPRSTATDATGRAGGYAQALSEQVDLYAVVVLAKARAAGSEFQRFVVMKILKGDAPDTVRLRVADRPADEGRLQVLFLRPQLGGSAEISPEPTPPQVPSAAETASTLAGLAVGVPVTYSYQGETAVLRELPPGTDPAAVNLP